MNVIITRHAALVDMVKQDFSIEGAEVLSHASPDAVRGKTVYGVLPLNLASLAEKVVTPDLRIPADLRGQELSLDQMRDHFHGWKAYKVQEVDL